ncbi:hypothetical protein [Paenibacillus hexagrammi]|uniref:Uncharacterized protein n=1 Tax=Paenibacillus hexagrammi TaxID=2908839 RepID=A0ABY3SQH2_9BACL|nr:hypothetical protein [Paenibacillus sp. YPD9-1]UJF36191.1 hypothetical protein L0M14_14695 [Paenibacillus sp. YPD9-1]
MNWTARIVITAFVSAAVAGGLSLLPKLDQYAGAPSSQAWSTGRSAQLTSDNLVDLLVQVPLQLRIRKVELSDSILFIDLSLPKNADAATVYRDLYTIAQTMNAKTKNVNQVMVRVMDYAGSADSSSAQLVLAMVADREHGKDLKEKASELTQVQLERQLIDRFRLTYTTRWQQRYPL